LNVPGYLLVFLVVVVPLGYALYVSLFHWELIRPPIRFIGLKGYFDLLRDPIFQDSAKRTLIFTAISVSATFVGGLGFATLLNREFRARHIVRGLIFIPWAIPPIAAGLLWSWLYHGQYGLLNYLLLKLGIIHEYVSFVASDQYALYAAIVPFVWQHIPFASLLLLAGMQAIPSDVQEAAIVDGAGSLQRFARITLPLLSNTTLLTLTFLTMWALRAFDIIYALTYGGPGNTTSVFSWYLYKTSFQYYNYGKGAATGVVMALITAALAVAFIRLLHREVEY
jgi:multiple sugar transport system permease protein